MESRRSKVALLAGILGGLALLDIVLAPLLIKLGVLSPLDGFRYVFGIGVLEGLIALPLGLIGLFMTRGGAATGRNLAWLGVAAGVSIFVLVAANSLPPVPPINDITTNTDDPPAFAADPSDLGRDMTYPPDYVAPAREAYPDLAPIELAAAPAEALAQAQRAAESLGWKVTTVRKTAGEFEAQEVSGLFEFVDDVAVRVRPRGTGSVVDVRSKSRDGQSDLGANAARIRRFQEALTN